MIRRKNKLYVVSTKDTHSERWHEFKDKLKSKEELDEFVNNVPKYVDIKIEEISTTTTYIYRSLPSYLS